MYDEKIAWVKEHLLVAASDDAQEQTLETDSAVMDMLCNYENCYLVAYEERDLTFLSEYMLDLGVEITFEPIEVLQTEEVKQKMIIYKLTGEKIEQTAKQGE